ncbi:MAG: DUF357 domain-containing protein [Thermofilaceae archaeon]
MESLERARRYIENLRAALVDLEGKDLGAATRVVEQARSYLSDAEFYLERGDIITSIACSSYAEGLLDALNLLSVARIEWPRKPRPRVIVGGAFEILHPGHLHLLRRARELGRVIVIVARDSTIQKLKGRPPIVPEQQRLEVVKSIRYVDEAYLGSDPLDVEGVLLKLRPDIVLLGPDQHYLEELVREAISRLNLGISVVKLENRVGTESFSSSAIFRKLSEHT